ncbi:anti-CBASS protein Acb1 family protein [Thalassobaculum litoreum]|uniref:Anti-CBASS protein Acb1-like N-terminal domain-containing protein n=1 Tax=Thalassobaculum litoreum DSM 18839 TaxID=1123362 RepID=A0A8G2EWI3_9PROT|nr:anti-CBASS Acb1 family protein [Thalassobaculum litoreum]SDF83396.1 hypothetical protein SAMN05660686_02464 [Thalassobaculum litoreum DSM 18839]
MADLNVMQALSMVTQRLRLAWYGQSALFDGRRKVWDSLGYPGLRERTAEFYWFRYKYQDIARRIVRAPADGTWQKPPVVQEDPDPEVSTPFEQAWETLQKRLHVYAMCKRADRIAGIGRYGVILLGVRDGRNLDQPMGTLSNESDVLYLSVYGEPHAKVAAWNNNPKSDRFGRPELYDIHLAADVQGGGFKTFFQSVATTRVHWTRIIHIADELDEDDIFGTPRLEAVMNRLIDIEKIVGGTGEMYWNGANRGIQWDVDKDAKFTDDDYQRLETQISEYLDGLRRMVKTQGVTANVLASNQPEPQEALQACIALIAGTTGIPQRILIGTEAGKLGSTQDERAWTNRIEERRENFAEPFILQELINRLIVAKALPAPAAGYSAGWPKLQAMNASERAQVGQRLANAAKSFADAEEKGNNPITAGEFREQIGLPALPPSKPQATPE